MVGSMGMACDVQDVILGERLHSAGGADPVTDRVTVEGVLLAGQRLPVWDLPLRGGCPPVGGSGQHARGIEPERIGSGKVVCIRCLKEDPLLQRPWPWFQPHLPISAATLRAQER
jgi:hypothetical protein